jgi:D-tagatose-1,6-bisphosphate aldolase subunit GatZ/KbaZ
MDAATEFGDRLARNRAGEAVGVTSVCSAHPLVLDAALRRAAARGQLLLVEATCNQVNQDGGYTGLTPAAFRDRLFAQADALGLGRHLLLLGGDHLGPNPWKNRPAAEAMQRAKTLIAAYAAAGYRKLHLDASMACADEAEPAPQTIAARAAELCAVAESAAAAAGLPPPLYVIGTEVPTPGGAREAMDHLAVTRPDDFARTLALHRAAFAARGLEAVLERAVAVVVQPGVEFGQDAVHDYRPDQATALVAALAAHPGVVFEAHSTDYQRAPALRALVQDHFAILKVGPELTFALREAVFALERIAAELTPATSSGVRAALEAAMRRDPSWWRGYYAEHDAIARAFSLSDRIRYYWPAPEVDGELRRLFADLAARPIPPTLVSQYLPTQYAAWRDGRIGLAPADLLGDRVGEVLARYAAAVERDGAVPGEAVPLSPKT